MQQQMLNNCEHKIRNPSVIGPIISVSIMSILHMRMLVLIMQNDNMSRTLFYIEIVPLLIFAIWLTCMIIKAFMKPSVLRIDQEALFVNGHTVEAHQIKMVMVMGYFKPIIGIKLKNKRYVPVHLCFRLMEDEDRGMKELKTWAEENQILFVHKRFARWM